MATGGRFVVAHEKRRWPHIERTACGCEDRGDVAVAISPADADADRALAQLAEFVGRLHLLLATVV